MKILNEEQLDIFMKAIQREPMWHDFFYTEITTGLRLGEICGLKWSDLDEKTGKLKIQRSVSHTRGGGVVAGKPKTEKQIRKWLADPYIDSAEYKLWGNGVALPCTYFVLSGIAWAAQRDTQK